MIRDCPSSSIVAFLWCPLVCAILLAEGSAPAEVLKGFDKAKSVSTAHHPYLLFTKADLPAIRKRSATQPALTFREALQRQGKTLRPKQLEGPGRLPTYNDRVHATRMARAALEGVLSGDRSYIDPAKEALLTLASWDNVGPRVNMSHGDVTRSAAITYDMLYDELSDGERKKVEAFLGKAGEFIYERAMKRSGGWSVRHTRAGNWRSTIYGGLGMVGLALWNTHPDARKWADEAAGVVRDVLDYDYDGDGGVYEAYVRYHINVSCHSFLPLMEAFRRVKGEDLFDHNNRVLHRMTAFTAYMLYPTLDAMGSFGDTSANLYPIGLSLAKSAAEYEDGLAGWYLDRLIKRGWTPGVDSAICGTLWARPVKLEDPETSPRLSEAFAYNNDRASKRTNKRTDHATGHVFLRTGFTRAADIYFAAQAGDCQGWHDHADKGAYILAAYGVKFLRDYFAGGYEGPQFTYRKSGRAHQSVLIDGEGQGTQFIGLRDSGYMEKVANVDLESHEGYDLVRMDLVKAYRINPKNRGMKKALRFVVFVRLPEREGYFVVIDDVRKDDEKHVYSHAFHYDPAVKVESAKGGRIVLKNPKASLHIAAVAPDGLKASRHTQYADSYVELTSPDPAVRFVMVTVLYPVRGKQSPPEFIPIRDGERTGVRVSGTEIIYDKSSGKVSVSGNLSKVTARKGSS